MFYGTSRISVDEKNRIRIPIKLRLQLGKDFVLFCGVKGYLFLMSQEEFEAKFASVGSISVTDEKHRALRRLMATAINPDEDQQGRFVIPTEMKDYINANKKLVFVGVGNMIEICSEETYNDFIEEVDLTESIKSLSDCGI